LGMQGLGQISGNPYLQPFNTSAMDKYGKQIGGYQSDISSLQQGMGRYDTDIARYQEQISGYEAQQQQQAEAKAAAAAAKQTQIGEIQAKIDALNQGGQEEGSRGWGGRSNTASKIKEYEEQIAQIQRGDTQRSSGWGSSKDRRSTEDAGRAASDLERGMQSAQRSLSGLTSEQTRDQSEIDRLTGLMGTAQGSYEEQQGLQGQWNQNNQQMYEQAQQNAQFNPQQFEQQFGGFDMNDYLNKVGGPMMESAFSTFGNRTIPMIANSFGAMDSARSSGMYDVLGRSAGEMMQGVYGQLAPQAFAAEQSSRDRMMTAEQSQKDRQLQAAQLQMTGGLGSQQLGIQGGLGMLDYGAQQAATAQQQAQAKATADFQKWQMEQPGMDPRLAMLLGQANQPAYSYIGMPGTQSPSTASQIAAPLASMYGDTGGLAGIMDLFKQK